MKHFFTFLLLTTLLASCSSDDSNQSNDSRILGKWALYKETYNGSDIYPSYVLDENDLIEIHGEVEKDFLESPEIDVELMQLMRQN